MILLNFFDDPAVFGGSKGLFDYLSAVDLRFVLDGALLETERTAIKRVTNPDQPLLDLFAVAFGAFLAPDALSVGPHEVRGIVLDPVYGDFDFTTPFTVVSC